MARASRIALSCSLIAQVTSAASFTNPQRGFPGALHDLRFTLPDQSGTDAREDVIQQAAVITRENGATASGGGTPLAHGDHLPRGGMRSLQDTCNLNSVLVESSLVPQAEGCYRKRSQATLLIFDHETENQSIYVELFGSEYLWLIAYLGSSTSFTTSDSIDFLCVSEESADDVGHPADATWQCDTDNSDVFEEVSSSQFSMTCGCGDTDSTTAEDDDYEPIVISGSSTTATDDGDSSASSGGSTCDEDSFTITSTVKPEFAGCFTSTGTVDAQDLTVYSQTEDPSTGDIIVHSAASSTDDNDIRWLVFVLGDSSSFMEDICISRQQADNVHPGGATWMCDLGDGVVNVSADEFGSECGCAEEQQLEPTLAPVEPEPPTPTPIEPVLPTLAPIEPEPPTPAPIEPEPPTPAPIEPDPPTPAPIVPEPPTPAPVEPEPPTPAPIVPVPPTPAPIEPEPPTPVPIEPVPPTVAPMDPEPPTPAPVGMEPATPAPVGLEPATPAPVGLEPATPAPVGLEPATSAPVGLEPATPAPVETEPPTPAPIEPVEPGSLTPAPIEAEPLTASPVATGEPTQSPAGITSSDREDTPAPQVPIPPPESSPPTIEDYTPGPLTVTPQPSPLPEEGTPVPATVSEAPTVSEPPFEPPTPSVTTAPTPPETLQAPALNVEPNLSIHDELEDEPGPDTRSTGETNSCGDNASSATRAEDDLEPSAVHTPAPRATIAPALATNVSCEPGESFYVSTTIIPGGIDDCFTDDGTLSNDEIVYTSEEGSGLSHIIYAAEIAPDEVKWVATYDTDDSFESLTDYCISTEDADTLHPADATWECVVAGGAVDMSTAEFSAECGCAQGATPSPGSTTSPGEVPTRSPNAVLPTESPATLASGSTRVIPRGAALAAVSAMVMSAILMSCSAIVVAA